MRWQPPLTKPGVVTGQKLKKIYSHIRITITHTPQPPKIDPNRDTNQKGKFIVPPLFTVVLFVSYNQPAPWISDAQILFYLDGVETFHWPHYFNQIINQVHGYLVHYYKNLFTLFHGHICDKFTAVTWNFVWKIYRHFLQFLKRLFEKNVQVQISK